MCFWEVLEWALRKAGVEEWLVGALLLECIDFCTQCFTETQRDTRSFQGVPQGPVLSHPLFNIVMDAITKTTHKGQPYVSVYADDLLMARWVPDEKEKLETGKS